MRVRWTQSVKMIDFIDMDNDLRLSVSQNRLWQGHNHGAYTSPAQHEIISCIQSEPHTPLCAYLIKLPCRLHWFVETHRVSEKNSNGNSMRALTSDSPHLYCLSIDDCRQYSLYGRFVLLHLTCKQTRSSIDIWSSLPTVVLISLHANPNGEKISATK